jgi:hypothetical protein
MKLKLQVSEDGGQVQWHKLKISSAVEVKRAAIQSQPEQKLSKTTPQQTN